MNMNEYRLAAIRKLAGMARQGKSEHVGDYCLKLANETAADEYFTGPLEWLGYLLECNLRRIVEERTGKVVEGQVIAGTDLMAGVQSLQFYIGGGILPLLHTENMEKAFTSSLEDCFSYHDADKGYYFAFRIAKIPSEGSIKIKTEREER
jgi:hypothetical protein